MSAPFNRLEIDTLCEKLAEGELLPPAQYGRVIATFDHLQEQAVLLAQVAAGLQRQLNALRGGGEG